MAKPNARVVSGSSNSANMHLDKIATQRAAAAAAIANATPEDDDIELARQYHIANKGIEVVFDYDDYIVSNGVVTEKPSDGKKEPTTGIEVDLADDPEEDEDTTQEPDELDTPQSIQEKLEQALQPVLDEDGEDDGPNLHAVGMANIQWVIADGDADNPDGYQFVLSVQVDEMVPGHVAFDLTPEMLDRWIKGTGLQKNRTEHTRFANGIIERAVEMAAKETGLLLSHSLEKIMYEYNQRQLAALESDVEVDYEAGDGV